jgi:hypothetical protein
MQATQYCYGSEVRLQWIERATTMGDTRNAYRNVVEKILFEDREGEEDNFKIDHREVR